MTVAELRVLDRSGLVSVLGSVFENSSWVAERVFDMRPFADLDALHLAMMSAVENASRAEQLALLRSHPELAGQEARAGTMTHDSTSEQGRLGFTSLTRAELERMTRLNELYRNKFGFPCIIALRHHEARDSVFAEHERRLANDPETEGRNCLNQIRIITRGRLERIFPHG